LLRNNHHNKSKMLRVCLTCSVGGHLKQMLKIAPSWSKYDHYFVVMYKPLVNSMIKNERVLFVADPKRNLYLFLKNIVQSWRHFIENKPDVVISTGAGVSIATCYIAKLFGKKIIYIEDWCVVEEPSLTGRFLYPIADLFIVQREHLKKFYPKAVYGGELF